MDPVTTKEGLEFAPTASSLNTNIVARCHCGRNWNVVMSRGEAGQPGCVRCSCDAELVSWSGTVIFSAFPAAPD